MPAMENQEEGEGGSSTKLSGSQEETTGVFHVIPIKDCCCFVLMRNEKHDYILKYSSYHIAAPNESPPSKKKALDALFGNSFTQRKRKSTSKTARAEVIRYRAKDALP